MERIEELRKNSLEKFFSEIKEKKEDGEIKKVSHDKCHVSKCKNCVFLDEIYFDHLFDNKGQFDYHGSFYKIHKENKALFFTTKGNKILFNNDFIKFLTSVLINEKISEFKKENKDVYLDLGMYVKYYYLCNFNFTYIREITLPLSEDIDPKTITRDIFMLYLVTSDMKYLHGYPHMSSFNCNSLGESRIIPSENSFFLKDSNYFGKNYNERKELEVCEDKDTFQIFDLDINYTKYNDNYYKYLWIIEFYCWMMSLKKTKTINSKSWNIFFRNLWQTEDYISVANDISLLENDFQQIFKTVSKYKLKKNIDDIMPF